MASTITTPELQQSAHGSTSLVVSLPSLSGEAFEELRAKLAEALVDENVVVATPDAIAPNNASGASFRVVANPKGVASIGQWTLTAMDYLNAHELVVQHQARGVLLLGAESQSLSASGLRVLAKYVLNSECDLVVPRYTLPPRSGLVNLAILYPISRTLFGAGPRFPQAIDVALSARMAERMASVAQRFTASNQNEALLWPVSEGAVAGYSIEQVDVGNRVIPLPLDSSLNTALAQVAGSLFADVEAKAAFWQRIRTVPAEKAMAQSASVPGREDVTSMIETFRLAYVNLQEIWSLVLPPQSLFGLKRLSAMPAESFAMPDSLWARIVYDFLLAYRLRTINRGHLLGALTPLYLAWAASHILLTEAGTSPEQHNEAQAAAFDAEKPYLVSRWRWPDRFNP